MSSTSAAHSIFKWVGIIVVVLMVVAIGYAAYISFAHWGGIGV